MIIYSRGTLFLLRDTSMAGWRNKVGDAASAISGKPLRGLSCKWTFRIAEVMSRCINGKYLYLLAKRAESAIHVLLLQMTCNKYHTIQASYLLRVCFQVCKTQFSKQYA
jgi:hypothetical protein